MALGYVQKKSEQSNPGANVACTFSSNPGGSGNVLLAFVAWELTSDLTSISDGVNGAWSPVASRFTGATDQSAFSMQMFWMQDPTAGATTVTATPASSCYIAMVVMEYNGFTNTPTLNGVAAYNNVDNDTTPTSPAITTTVADAIIVAACFPADFLNSMSGPFTSRAGASGDTLWGGGMYGDVIASSLQTGLAATWNQTTGTWSVITSILAISDGPEAVSTTAFALSSPLFQSRRPMPMMRGPDLDRPRYKSYQGRDVSTGMPRFDAQSFKDFTTTANGSWTHTPVTATPRGVVVLIAQNVVSTDLITGVTYGGVAMTRIPTNGIAQDTVGEPGAAYAYFLGSNVPAGAQTVAVTVSSGTDAKTGWAVTLSGDADQAIAASGRVQVDTLNPSVTLATDGYFDGTCLSVFYSGLNAPTDGTITAGSGFTKLTASAAGGRDFGTQSACAEYDNATGANVVCNWTAASDDCAMIALAVKRSP